MYPEYFHGEEKEKENDNFIQREKICMTCALHVVVLIKMKKIFEIGFNKSNFYFFIYIEWDALHKPHL